MIPSSEDGKSKIGSICQERNPFIENEKQKNEFTQRRCHITTSIHPPLYCIPSSLNKITLSILPFSPQNNSLIIPPLFTAITQHNNHHSLITHNNHNHTPLSPFLVPFRLQSTSKQSIAPNYQIPCISMDKWRSKMIG